MNGDEVKRRLAHLHSRGLELDEQLATALSHIASMTVPRGSTNESVPRRLGGRQSALTALQKEFSATAPGVGSDPIAPSTILRQQEVAELQQTARPPQFVAAAPVDRGSVPAEQQGVSALRHAMFLQSQLVSLTTPDGFAAPAVDSTAFDSHSSRRSPPAAAAPAAERVVPEADSQEHPSEPKMEEEHAAPSVDWEARAAAALESGVWKTAVDKQGRTYYMNKKEKLTVWNLAKELQRREA